MLYKEGSAWELPRADPFCLLPWSADPICTAVQPVPPDMAAGPCRPVDFGVVLWYTGGKETKNAAAPGSGDSRKACNGIPTYPAQQEFLHRFISITVLQCFHKGRESQAWRFPLAVCLRGRKRGGLWSIVIHMLRG